MHTRMESDGAYQDDCNSASFDVLYQSFCNREKTTVKSFEVLKKRSDKVKKNEGKKTSFVVISRKIQIKDPVPEYAELCGSYIRRNIH